MGGIEAGQGKIGELVFKGAHLKRNLRNGASNYKKKNGRQTFTCDKPFKIKLRKIGCATDRKCCQQTN